VTQRRAVDLPAPRAAGPSDRDLSALLALAAAQLDVAIRETDEPVAALASSVATLGASPAGIAATTALQFHDRLVQQIGHVRDTLASLATFVDQPAGGMAGTDWEQLRNAIRERYSMEQEKLMFDLLVRGTSAADIIRALGDLAANGAPGHSDLF
jgi:hypothetical protein